MKISQVKELVTKMFEEDDSLKYAIATNMAKYGRPDSRPGDKKAKLTKGLEKKREKHVLDLKKSMDENQEAEKAIRDTLSKEGGAAGLEPLVKAVKKFGIGKEELVKLLKKLAKVKKHRDGDYILTPISEDDEGSAFPGESPSRGYMEARKLIDQLRATTFKKLNNDELYDFRKTIATAFDMSLRESEVSHGGQKGGAPIDLSEDIKDDLKKIANSLKSQFDDLRFDVNYNKYNPENSRIDVRGTQQDMMDFGNKLQGKKFGEYEVFATDDDDRGEIVRIVRSDQIMGNEGRKEKNPSMGIVRKKLGKVPKAGKVAYQKKMKLPTGLINYMDYTIGEGHGLDQGDIDKIKTLAKALRDGGDLSQDVGLRKDAVRILSFLIKSNILQDKTKDLSKGKVDEKKKKKDDRCTRIAKRKYDTWPSAYASGAVVRCRKGEIWKKEK